MADDGSNIPQPRDDRSYADQLRSGFSSFTRWTGEAATLAAAAAARAALDAGIAAAGGNLTGSDLPRSATTSRNTDASGQFVTTEGSDSYKHTSLVFPSKLNEADGINGHSMLININVPSYSGAGQTTGPSYGTSNLGYTPTNALSRAENYRQNLDGRTRDARGRTMGGFGGANAYLTVNRNTTRIQESILLYMPSTVSFSSQNIYDDLQLTEMLAGAGKAAIGGAVAAGGAKGRAFGAVMSGAGTVTDFASKLNNTPINPRVEVIYNRTPQRMFEYTFLFAPASQEESITLERIIRTIRFHAAPEMTNSGLGIASPFFMTPPAEFDITFFHKGVENRAIPRINTCALESIDVDYAPEAWSTFQNGHPVFVRMILRFKEIHVVDKLKVLQGF